METELREKLEKIKEIVDVEKILSITMDAAYIQKYYKINKISYSVFHTRTNFVHMGITRDGKYKEDDLLEQVRIVEWYIEKFGASNVLELATGRGANSLWLARKHPDVQLHGIDYSEDQLSFAFRGAKKLLNYHPAFGDYHDLKRYDDGIFDIVFIVEALCHSTEKDMVLREAHRILKPGGVFVVFEPYLGEKPEALETNERLALELAQRGAAVTNAGTHQNLLEKAKSAEFSIELTEDVSAFVIPTMERFETSA